MPRSPAQSSAIRPPQTKRRATSCKGSTPHASSLRADPPAHIRQESESPDHDHASPTRPARALCATPPKHGPEFSQKIRWSVRSRKDPACQCRAVGYRENRSAVPQTSLSRMGRLNLPLSASHRTHPRAASRRATLTHAAQQDRCNVAPDHPACHRRPFGLCPPPRRPACPQCHPRPCRVDQHARPRRRVSQLPAPARRNRGAATPRQTRTTLRPDPRRTRLRHFDDTGVMRDWPARRGQQILCLWTLLAQLPSGPALHERALSARLNTLHSFRDAALLRRAMVGLGLLGRTADGTAYTRREQPPPPPRSPPPEVRPRKPAPSSAASPPAENPQPDPRLPPLQPERGAYARQPPLPERG